MEHNFIFEDVSSALPHLLNELLSPTTPEVPSRAGKTRELRHVGITLDYPWRRELLVPERKTTLAAQIAETAWVLAGRNDVEWLSHYLPRARDFSDDGEVWRGGYGPRLRDWHGIDQLAHIVETLRRDPSSRQAVAVLYDPSVDTQPGKDIPCNNWLSFSCRDGILDLHVAIRSNDVMWGWSGINAFEWSVLLEVVAGLVGVKMGALHFSVTSFHLYERHWEKAKKIVVESARTACPEVADSPRFNPLSDELGDFNDLLARWFQIEYDIRTGSPLVVGYIDYIDSFPEPMLRSWLRVLDWWWNRQHRDALSPIFGTALEAALVDYSVKPPWQRSAARVVNTPSERLQTKLLVEQQPPVSDFLSYAIKTHNEKHVAYGDSWKRRGEMLGIMANIARKIDRLGGAETSDETSADTAMDLMIYLAKYRTWLRGRGIGSQPLDLKGFDFSDQPEQANALLVEVEKESRPLWMDDSAEIAEDMLRDSFDQLEKLVVDQQPSRYQRVDTMLRQAYRLARYRFEHQDDDYQGADSD